MRCYPEFRKDDARIRLENADVIGQRPKQRIPYAQTARVESLDRDVIASGCMFDAANGLGQSVADDEHAAAIEQLCRRTLLEAVP